MTEDIQNKKAVKKDVATSVITSSDKILILRRSNKVSTYHGKWACVSGYLEAGEAPLETAFKEIWEEIGLGKEEIELLKEGEVLNARDNQFLWVIHPFLFKTKRTDIKIDWEHVEYKWVLPGEINNYDTVPKLQETIESLLLEIM